MAATRTQRIIYTAISATIIVIISSFYRYKPNILEDQLETDGHKPERMNIVVWNQNPEGSGAWVELHCKGHLSKNTSVAEWTTKLLLQPRQNAVITLPEIKGSDAAHLLCKYQGWNGCQAENFKVFVNPGNDIYYCSESVKKCSIVFQSDGSVEKQYEDRETIFLGYVPSPENKEKCSWIDCHFDPRRQVIGNRSCCGANCA